MNPKSRFFGATFRYLLAVICTMALIPGDTLAYAQSPSPVQASLLQDQAAKIPPDQLRLSRGAHCFVSGPVAGADPRRINVSSRNHSASAVAR